jgi:hypothetical protein
MPRANFKTWKMGLPEDSEAWQDLLAYGRELGMQPAETARVILVEWSQARRGHMSLGCAMPELVRSVPQTPVREGTGVSRSKRSEKDDARERAKTRGARFAGALDLDDD